MNLDLGGRLALVTGAARGIGLAEAEALAVEGCRVVVSDLDREGAEAAAATLRDRGTRLGRRSATSPIRRPWRP